jgi:uncharacterized protein (DUF2461 family)
MSFHGWPAEALEFYDGLEADNSKAYWTERKPVYEETVLGPMTALVWRSSPRSSAILRSSAVPGHQVQQGQVALS